MKTTYIAFDIDHTLFNHEPSWESDRAKIQADWDYFTRTDEFIRTAIPNDDVIYKLNQFQAQSDTIIQLITARGVMDDMRSFTRFLYGHDVDVNEKDIIFCGSNSAILGRYPNSSTAKRKSYHVRDTLESLRLADVSVDQAFMFDDDLDNLEHFLKMGHELPHTKTTAYWVVDGKQIIPYFNM